MTTTQKSYVGDIGTVIELDTGADLGGATSLTIEARRPDGTTVTWTATADGQAVRYVIQAGDLSQAGRWQLQARTVLPTGTWLGATAELRVFAAFA